MPISLLVASSDEHFRETVRESLVNAANARVVSEYPEVSSNLYIRVLQDLERNPDAALIVDLASDPDAALKALEKVKQAVTDGKLSASASDNMRAWLTEPRYAAYADEVAAHVAEGKWQVANWQATALPKPDAK